LTGKEIVESQCPLKGFKDGGNHFRVKRGLDRESAPCKRGGSVEVEPGWVKKKKWKANLKRKCSYYPGEGGKKNKEGKRTGV